MTVYNNGTNVWLSLAMHDSECEIKVHEFPFDSQKCILDFASESYDAKSLNIHLLSGTYFVKDWSLFIALRIRKGGGGFLLQHHH